MLFHSARMALNFDEGFSAGTTSIGERSRQLCLSSTDEITSILRKVRHQYGLKYSPIIFIYGIVQANRTLSAFGASEGCNSLLAVLEECSVAWVLARQMKGRASLGYAPSVQAECSSDEIVA